MHNDEDKKWGGRFSAYRDQAFDRLNASLPFDWRLAVHDVMQNRAYATELAAIDVLSEKDLDALDQALTQIEAELQDGSFPFNLGDEDIHMNIESRLTSLAGDAGKRIHTGRSRNDQVATVVRLWLRDGIDLLCLRLRDLIETSLTQAEVWADLLIPGYTHLQRAQIVTFGHHTHAYAEMFLRDLARLLDVRARMNFCPLGSGALAASPYPVDRDRLAQALDFDGPTRNSMDAVSDRDFMFEFAAACALIGVHLSRWAEDVTLWMSAEFGWIDLPDALCTGSSIMPQKKNPDLAELARGKSGRLLGSVTSLAMTLKGLPLTYNKDLQEDKPPVFDAWLTCHDLLDVWQTLVAGMQPRPERMADALQGGHLLATDLADHLVQAKGLPFRDAHHIVGNAVAAAEEAGVDLSDLSLDALQAVDARLDADAKAALTTNASFRSRNRFGGPALVRENIAATRKHLESLPEYEALLPWAFALQPPASLS